MLQPLPHLLSLAPYQLPDVSGPVGKHLIQLAQNEAAVAPGKAALEAAGEALNSVARYPVGDTALRAAIGSAEGLDAERIVCAAGSMELISLLTQAYLGPGREAIMSQYGYLFFATMVQAAGATLIRAPEQGFRADVDTMLAQVTPETVMVFLVNPNNPTGSVLAKDEVRRLRAGLREDILLVLDAAYAEFVTADNFEAGAKLVEETGNTVMLRTFSKIHGLAGLRVGWGYFPVEAANIVRRLSADKGLSAVSIAAATAAIADHKHVSRHRQLNDEVRRWTFDELVRMELEPLQSQGNFILVRFPSAAGHCADSAFAHLRSEGIIVRPMASYGLPDCLRVTVGSAQEMAAFTSSLSVWRCVS